MNQTFFDRIPSNLPGGFFVYRASGEEELCFADQNVLRLYGCETMDEFREYTGNSFRGMVFPGDLDRVESEISAQMCREQGEHLDPPDNKGLSRTACGDNCRRGLRRR